MDVFERVAPGCFASVRLGTHQRIIGRGKWQLVDDQQLQHIAGQVNALPKRSRGHQYGPPRGRHRICRKALQQFTLGRIALCQYV